MDSSQSFVIECIFSRVNLESAIERLNRAKKDMKPGPATPFGGATTSECLPGSCRDGRHSCPANSLILWYLLCINLSSHYGIVCWSRRAACVSVVRKIG